jgi:hypothetical protein
MSTEGAGHSRALIHPIVHLLVTSHRDREVEVLLSIKNEKNKLKKKHLTHWN